MSVTFSVISDQCGNIRGPCGIAAALFDGVLVIINRIRVYGCKTESV